MNSKIYVFAMIIVMAVVNYLLRASAFLIFRDPDRMPDWLIYLSKVLPPAIMAFLVVYCLKNVSLFSENHALPEIVAIVITVITYLEKNNALLAIGISTVVYMLLVQNFF